MSSGASPGGIEIIRTDAIWVLSRPLDRLFVPCIIALGEQPVNRSGNYWLAEAKRCRRDSRVDNEVAGIEFAVRIPVAFRVFAPQATPQ